MNRRSILLTLFQSLLLARGAAVTRWSPRGFPNPAMDSRQCKSQGSTRICDPDGVLGEDDKSVLIDAIETFEDTHTIPCSSVKTDEGGFDIQLAVALVNKMDLREYRNFEDKEKHAAEEFAITLHNTWGVGSDSPCGGTGILVFLSMHDRAIYISTGDALKPVLTDHRLDKVMTEMKPLLRQVKYGDALQTAVYEIGKQVESGEPKRIELLWAFLSTCGRLLHLHPSLDLSLFKDAYSNAVNANMLVFRRSSTNSIDIVRKLSKDDISAHLARSA